MKRAFAAIAVVVAVGGVAGCSRHYEGPEAFDVSGFVVGNVDHPSGLTPHESCKFYDGLVSVGDPIVAHGADGAILGKGYLAESSIENGPACAFKFSIPNVKAGESGYTLTLSPYDPVTLSESEIRNPRLGLNTRTAMDVLTNNQEAQITLDFS